MMTERLDCFKIAKLAVGVGIAITLAEKSGLRYSASAGIITLLSIQDTKRETIRVMTRRLCSFLLSLILAAACFRILGYGALAIVVFLLPFSAFCIRFGMQEGISVNTVLVTHFLTEQSMTSENIRNEALLLLIGAGIGLALNLYIPGKKRLIKRKQRQIENQMRQILKDLSGRLSGEGVMPGAEEVIKMLEEDLEQGKKSAYEDMENQLLSETRYYIRYMNMRGMQVMLLERIDENIRKIRTFPPQSARIAHLMDHISASFHEYNNALGLLIKLDDVKNSMRLEPLPADREEFESRAILYQILLELEQFLIIKREFVCELSREELERFWE